MFQSFYLLVFASDLYVDPSTFELWAALANSGNVSIPAWWGWKGSSIGASIQLSDAPVFRGFPHFFRDFLVDLDENALGHDGKINFSIPVVAQGATDFLVYWLQHH